MRSCTVFTDASFCKDTGNAGWAVWLSGDGGVKIRKHGPFRIEILRSDLAEIYAALNGVYIAKSAGFHRILLQTDCMAAIQVLTGGVNNRQRRWLKRLNNRHKIDLGGVLFRHVKGHTELEDKRSWVNRWCDEKARESMRMARSEIP